jgi:hypothetical protein
MGASLSGNVLLAHEIERLVNRAKIILESDFRGPNIPDQNLIASVLFLLTIGIKIGRAQATSELFGEVK